MFPLLGQTTVDSSFTYSPVFLIGNVICLGVGIWAAVDANKHPDAAWQASGQSKTLWMVLPIVMGLCCGLLVAIPVLIYFLSIKPKLEQAGGGGYGGPPPGYPPQ